MAGAWGQGFLQFQISNKTRNTTLRYYRKKDIWDPPEVSYLHSVLPPGSSDSSFLLSSSNALGLGWLVVYKAESFTLAAFFFLPKKRDGLPKTLQLELSLDKAHLGDFRETFSRMTLKQDPPDPERTAASRAEFSGQGSVSLWLSTGLCKVVATASCQPTPRLEVEMEDREFVAVY